MSRLTASNLTEEVSRLVHAETGIQLNQSHSTMIESRLTKRMIELGHKEPDEYLTYLKKNADAEIQTLVSLITTHHTFFFREFSQFEFLEKEILPKLIAKMRAEKRTTMRVLSAACSRGHEVYTLAMFLKFQFKVMAPEMNFEILGSDVDVECVNYAKNGVYPWKELKTCPSIFIGNYWIRGTGEIAEFVKASQELRKHCKFQVGNLLKVDSELRGERFDLIFCRNVFIYFSKEQITTISKALLKTLNEGGAFFIGVSESLNGLDIPVSRLSNSIYTHKTVESPKVDAAPAATATQPQKPLRVLCVDDSPTVLALLKQILKPEYGFEVAATAGNGKEAAKVMEKQKFDLVTLDIHMPEMTGPEYLQSYYGPNHPPVLMISSVSREDSDLAMKCIALGAKDYVEKPQMATMKKSGDEIRSKLKYLARTRGFNRRESIQIENSFAKSTSQSVTSNQKIRLVFADPRKSTGKVHWILKELGVNGPPVVFFATQGTPEELKAKISEKVPLVKTLEGRIEQAQPGQFFVASRWALLDSLILQYGTGLVSAMILDGFPDSVKLKSLKKLQILIEEGLADDPVLKNIANDYSPVTSFVYLSDQFFVEKAA